MACPTCGYTMQQCSEKIWWCPRCGTLKDNCPGLENESAPKLVGRVREFGALIAAGTDAAGTVRLSRGAEDWCRLGIPEAIGPAEPPPARAGTPGRPG